MRGKEDLGGNGHLETGITPAHAGKRGPGRERAPGDRDHPRTCGEKYQEDDDMTQDQGSPPHMRGKARVRAHGVGHVGITPAHAGKSSDQRQRLRLRWDHPRTCGEKLCVVTTPTGGSGSPPHMRGKDPLAAQEPPCTGITPAHAGKSLLAEHFSGIIRDHPRTCGEKHRRYSGLHGEPGSPPHMRGKDSESLERQALIFSSAHFPFNF